MARVLIVDDNPENCRPMLRMLHLLGLEASCAYSGQEAVESMSHDPPELVLLDIMMPGMNGFDVLSTVRSQPWGERIPIIMFSALSDPSSIKRARQLGANEYLVKGRTTFDQMEEVVHRYVPGPV